MDRLELLGKIKKELKVYKEYLLNLLVVSNLDEEVEEKEEVKSNKTDKKKIKVKN